MAGLARINHEKITKALEWRDALTNVLSDESEPIKIVATQRSTLDLARFGEARGAEVTAAFQALIAKVDAELSELGLDVSTL